MSKLITKSPSRRQPSVRAKSVGAFLWTVEIKNRLHNDGMEHCEVRIKAKRGMLLKARKGAIGVLWKALAAVESAHE